MPSMECNNDYIISSTRYMRQGFEQNYGCGWIKEHIAQDFGESMRH